MKNPLSNFIVFEGIDGSGKTTQLRILQKRLEAKPTFFTAEPTTLQTGRFLRSILQGESVVHPTTLAYLFATDRAEHVYAQGGIVEHCIAGDICVCDRYLFSNLAYQGAQGDGELAKKLNADFPLPRIVFYFDTDVQTSLQRMHSRDTNEIFEKQDFLQRAIDEYKKTFAYYKKICSDEKISMDIVFLDATKSEEDIAGDIWQHLQPIIGNL